MRGLAVIGIVLLLAGLASLIWPTITYTRTKKAVDLGPIEVTTQDKEHIPLSPVFGIAAAATGIVLIVVGSRRTA